MDDLNGFVFSDHCSARNLSDIQEKIHYFNKIPLCVFLKIKKYIPFVRIYFHYIEA